MAEYVLLVIVFIILGFIVFCFLTNQILLIVTVAFKCVKALNESKIIIVNKEKLYARFFFQICFFSLLTTGYWVSVFIFFDKYIVFSFIGSIFAFLLSLKHFRINQDNATDFLSSYKSFLSENEDEMITCIMEYANKTRKSRCNILLAVLLTFSLISCAIEGYLIYFEHTSSVYYKNEAIDYRDMYYSAINKLEDSNAQLDYSNGLIEYIRSNNPTLLRVCEVLYDGTLEHK